MNLASEAAPPTGADRGMALCHTCWFMTSATSPVCARCHASLHLRTPNSLQRTLALLLTSTILLLPANLLPIMITDQLGTETPSTIVGGVVLLWNLESYPIAIVIFVASVVVPIGKIIIMFYLCWLVRFGQITGRRERTRMYLVTEFIGRWSMIDVFVVALLVALVDFGAVLEIRPGIGAIAFACVVIVTMFAAESFEQRLIWDRGAILEDEHD